MKIESYDGVFYKLKATPPKVVDWLKYFVPAEYKYMEVQGPLLYWYIHTKYVSSLVQFVEKCLPEEEITRVENLSDRLEAFSTLYLIPSAPRAIIDAVWKQLAKMYHPDRGGDAELFRKYKDAYNIVRKG